jgi:hypothetical protein
MDRAYTAFRQPLVSGILRLLGEETRFNSYDAAIADFMFELNRRSGGIMFEVFDEEKGRSAFGSMLGVCEAATIRLMRRREVVVLMRLILSLAIKTRKKQIGQANAPSARLPLICNGRGGEIRTPDPLLPKQVLAFRLNH